MQNSNTPLIQSSLKFHTFENEVAVYDSVSGKLHLLPFLGVELLKLMQQGSNMCVLVNTIFTFNDFDNQKENDADIEEAEMMVKQFIDSYRDLGLLD